MIRERGVEHSDPAVAAVYVTTAWRCKRCGRTTPRNTEADAALKVSIAPPDHLGHLYCFARQADEAVELGGVRELDLG